MRRYYLFMPVLIDMPELIFAQDAEKVVLCHLVKAEVL